IPHHKISYSQTIVVHRAPLQESKRRLLAAAVGISLISSFPSTHAQAHTIIQHLNIENNQTRLLSGFEPQIRTQDLKALTKVSANPSNAENISISMDSTVQSENPFAQSTNPTAHSFYLDKANEKSPCLSNLTDDVNIAPRVISTLLPAGASATGIVAEATLAGTKVGLYQTLIRVLQHFGASGFAGAVGAAIVYPLDTIKTRLQAQSMENGDEPKYKDEMDCFRKLMRNEGPASLYSGLIPQLIGIAPEKAIKFTVNEFLLNMLEQAMPGVSIWVLEFIAGGGGGFSQVVVTNPMEIVKVRLQTQSKVGVSKNLWAVINDLGLEGLYSGSGITMARDVPSSAVFFAGYTLLCQLYPDQSFLDGCVAAIPATILVTPCDVIKTRLQ
ncbi:hypothetical protein KI387_044455, partial [Taxus chinensis]